MDYFTQIVNKCITGCFPQTTHASRCHPLGKWQMHADDSLNVGGYLPHLITKKSKKAWYVGQMGLTEGKTETIKVLQEAQNELCEISSLTAHKGKKGDNPKESGTSRWVLRGKSTYSQKYLFVFGKQASSSSAPCWNDQEKMHSKAGERSEHHAEHLRNKCLQGINLGQGRKCSVPLFLWLVFCLKEKPCTSFRNRLLAVFNGSRITI